MTDVRLGMFMMPVHPLHRAPSVTLREDREAIILADKLGFHDVFVGEHLTDKAENITNSLQFLATLIHSTKTIKLGSGTCNLSHAHPSLIAAQAAMFDHLAEGRFIFGISPGALPSDAEVLGILEEDRNKLFAEAIDIILAIWERDPPYDIELPNNRFRVSTGRTLYEPLGVGVFQRPFQSPRPEIVGTVVAPFSKGVIAMGERDFHPLSANFLLPKWLKSHWNNFAEGKRNAGQTASTSDWRVARTVFVADTREVALSYGSADSNSPYRFYYSQLLAKLRKGNRQEVFKHSREQSDDELTVDYVLDNVNIVGTVDEVVDQILSLREEVGHFGELVCASMDWVDPKLAQRSMQLLAEQVMPRVNAAIKAGATADSAA